MGKEVVEEVVVLGGGSLEINTAAFELKDFFLISFIAVIFLKKWNKKNEKRLIKKKGNENIERNEIMEEEINK